MGTIGQLFPLTDNTGGAVVYQVQQQHLFISKLRVNICLQVIISIFVNN